MSAEGKQVRMSWWRRFWRYEEMTGNGICPLYLRRWTLFRRGERAVYLHQFVGDDWSRDLHDHPKRFISIGLWGSYVEETAAGMRVWRAPWVRSFAPEHAHRIFLLPDLYRQGYRTKLFCWTLVIVGRKERDWGWWHQGRWYASRTYLGMPAARERRSCP